MMLSTPRLHLIFLLSLLLNCCLQPTDTLHAQASTDQPRFGIVIHGGAGQIRPDRLNDEQRAAYERKLQQARDAGYAILQDGGSATDAVQAAIQVMESSPLFNAGYGAVLTRDGRAECDASIMDGKTHHAGAVAGVGNVMHPIALANAVMTETQHVLLVGEGAERFAVQAGMATIENDALITAQRREQWENMRREDSIKLDHNIEENKPLKKHGTVGAVALDQAGNLAAGTSTGGMMNKMPGRVGDSPIIGAGTYADNATCAVSGTGHGEHFIRRAVAYDISARMRYLDESLEQAANAVVMDTLKRIEAEGGVIALDAKGNMALPFNTSGMFRAWRLSDERQGVRLFDEAFYED
ncbi:MAG: isoaspartyl peptidase/L-asparaginase family protein [Bacteroidota bacterium]